MIDRDRAEGALLGLAVGDALGTTCEFEALDAPRFPTLATGPVTSIVGGGPFDLEPGQVTDDTQMACALAGVLAAGRPTADALMARYLTWSEVCFDIGYQTHAAINLARAGTPAIDAGRLVWEQVVGRKPAGNGSLMRTAPIGVLRASDPADRLRLSLLDASLTHFDPRCQLACAGFNAAIARAVISGGSPAELTSEATAELERAAVALREKHPAIATEIDQAATDLAGDLEMAKSDDPELYEGGVHLHRTQGFVRVAWRLAFWELHHAPSYAAAMIDATNRGGDADTNAAIAGALYGAVVGRSAIPTEWIDAVLAAPGLEGDSFHPRELLGALGS